MGFTQQLTAAEIAAALAIPTANDIDTQPNSVQAATEALTAAVNSATAQIRSMTRVFYTLTGAGTLVPSVGYTYSVPISVTDINRCQVNLLGFSLGTGGAAADYPFCQPSLYAASNSAITLVKASNSFTVYGALEIMEWV